MDDKLLTDNMLVGHELVHYLKNRETKGTITM